MPNRITSLLLIGVAACGSNKDAGPATGDKVVASDHAPVAKRPLAADFFGKVVAPPGQLAALKWDMPVAAAKQAAPSLFVKGDKDYRLVDDPAVEGVSYGIGLDKAKHVVSRLNLSLPPAAKGMLATAWGPGKDGKDMIGRPRTYWFDAGGGWRAYLEPGFGENVTLELHPYLPAAKLLGDGGDTLGFAPQGVLGATVADLRARFPDTIVERSDAQAAADQKAASKLAGTDLSKQLGAAHADVSLALLPTEWGEYTTPVNFDWTEDNKVDDVWFALPYEAYGPARDEIHALIEHKWGTGKDIEFLGGKAQLYRTKAPFVVVSDDTISHAWDVRLVAKQPR